MLSVLWFYSFLSESGTQSFKEATLVLPYKMFANIMHILALFDQSMSFSGLILEEE